MNPRTLIVTSADPRTSPRPAEAVRIAAGVGAWRKTDITLLLRGPAAYALIDDPDALVDGDHMERYLPLLADAGSLIAIDADFGDSGALEAFEGPYRRLDETEVARLYADNDYVITV